MITTENEAKKKRLKGGYYGHYIDCDRSDVCMADRFRSEKARRRYKKRRAAQV